MVYKIAVVDDEEEMLSSLEEGVRQVLSKEGMEGEIHLFSRSEDFLASKEGPYAIVLLDIQMEGMDGMACARKLRERDEKAVIIFITSLASYAVQGYKVDALDYIIKPVAQAELSSSLKRALEKVRRSGRGALAVRSEGGVAYVKPQDVLYVEAVNHSCVIHTRLKDIHSASTLNALEAEFQPYGFYRCHAAFLVNLSKVERVTVTDAVVRDKLVPISKHRRKTFLRELASWWGKQL